MTRAICSSVGACIDIWDTQELHAERFDYALRQAQGVNAQARGARNGAKEAQGAQEGRKALVGERSVETQSRKSLRIAVEREMIILKRSVSQGIVIIFGS